MTITEFLLARIVDREMLARDMQHQEGLGRPLIALLGGGTLIRELVDPARMLAECESDRRIVERCRPRYAVVYRESERLLAEAFNWPTVQTVAQSGPIWPFAEAEAVLRDLAAVHADHPDYRDEWRPEK